MCRKRPLLSDLQLIRELGNINVKKKEPPFCYPYSLKARVLVLAHLARMDVSEELDEGGTLTFDNDRQESVTTCHNASCQPSRQNLVLKSSNKRDKTVAQAV